MCNIISVYNSSQIMYNRYGSNYVYTQQPKEKRSRDSVNVELVQ